MKRVNIFNEGDSSHKKYDSSDDEALKLNQEVQHMMEFKRHKTKNLKALLQEFKRERNTIHSEKTIESRYDLDDMNTSFVERSIHVQPYIHDQSNVESESSRIVHIPKDENILDYIHGNIFNLIEEGIRDVKEFSEKGRTLFPDTMSSEYTYYIWRAFSLLQGDSLVEWSTKPCRPYENGPLLIPPTLHFSEYSETVCDDEFENLSSDSDDDLDIIMNNEPRNHLTKSQRRKLDCSLRNLTISKTHIAHVMVYCIRHSEASEEIVKVITESILSPHADTSKKISRLYLLSDILYNSNSSTVDSLHHMWKYRIFIESRLVEIVEHWKKISLSMGKLKMEHMTRIMFILLDIWSGWSVFPLSTIESLKRNLVSNINDTEYDDIDGLPLEE